MADDGMLMNFTVSEEPWQPNAIFKGGRWKDRLTAKKSAQRSRRNASGLAGDAAETNVGGDPGVATGANGTEFPVDRSAKRQRTDTAFRPAGRSTHHEGTRDGMQRSGGSGKPHQVISSLFTYNPSSTVQKPSIEEQDGEQMAPSNAPLSSELDTFTSLGLSRSLAQHLLTKMNIKAPTAIQSKAVMQLVKEDSDAFIQAETGSGKTLAYLLPIVQRIMQMSDKMRTGSEEGVAGFTRHSGLFAVILVPTRELSKQILTVLESLLGCAHWIVAGTVLGGEKKKSEKARLRKGLNILVATPGRLADHLDNTEVLDVSCVRWLVLDEGDRLMELGFEKDIQKIVSVLNLRMRATSKDAPASLPEKRTTVLCSATMKMNVQKLGEISLKSAEHIAAAPETSTNGGDAEDQSTFSAPAQLKQSYALVPAKLRLVTLVAVLRRAFARRGSVMKTIVFISCADSVDFHFELLTRVEKGKSKGSEDSPKATQAQRGGKIEQGGTIEETKTESLATAFSSKDNPVQLFRLHGSLPQHVRTSTLKAYTNSKEPAVLICTDVASRGLDLPNVDFVVEYDPPFSKEDHLHRIGRTARAGRDGRALIFLQPGNEESYVDILKEGRRDAARGLARHEADELLRRGFSPATGVVSSGREWEIEATDWQLDVERWALENPKHLEQARRAFQSHIRAYATHVAAERHMFDLKTLHLGHLAKAFALRDRPGSINVPGMRPGKESGAKDNAARKVKAARQSQSNRTTKASLDDVAPETDSQEAARRMRSMMKKMGGASEFNLG